MTCCMWPRQWAPRTPLHPMPAWRMLQASLTSTRRPCNTTSEFHVYDTKPHFNNLFVELKGSPTSLVLATAPVYPRPRLQPLWLHSSASSGARLYLDLFRIIFSQRFNKIRIRLNFPHHSGRIWAPHWIPSLCQPNMTDIQGLQPSPLPPLIPFFAPAALLSLAATRSS